MPASKGFCAGVGRPTRFGLNACDSDKPEDFLMVILLLWPLNCERQIDQAWFSRETGLNAGDQNLRADS